MTIGDRVYTSPMTQLIAVNHVFDDPARPFVEQGITADAPLFADMAAELMEDLADDPDQD